MGNILEFINEFDDTAGVDISNKSIYFLNSQYQALSIFQRNNYQVFQVEPCDVGIQKRSGQLRSLKIIPSINFPQAKELIEGMRYTFDHKNISKIYNILTENSESNLQILSLEEFYKGTSLRYIKEKILKQKSFNLLYYGIDKQSIMHMLIQLVRIVEELHQQGLAHGGITMDNIIISYIVEDEIPILNVKLIETLKHQQLQIINRAALNREEELPTLSHLPPELEESDMLSYKQIESIQSADIWEIGCILFEIILLLQKVEKDEWEEESKYTSITYLRECNSKTRRQIIKETVKDIGMQELLLNILLCPWEKRPTTAQLLATPLFELYGYLQFDIDSYFASIVNKSESVSAFISGLSLINKNKSIIAMLGLFNVYKYAPKSLVKQVRDTHSHIYIIEMLTICLKDKDSDFLPLYENGIQILTQILAQPRNAELKMKAQVGGIVSLLINIIEKEGINPILVMEFLESCALNYTNTIMNIAEKCGFVKEAFQLVKSPKYSSYSIRFLCKIGHLLNPSEILNLKSFIPLDKYFELISQIPLSKRTHEFNLEMCKQLGDMFAENSLWEPDKIIPLTHFVSAVHSLLTLKETLIACQIHSLCHNYAQVIHSEISYWGGFMCKTCSMNNKWFQSICLVCAHRCHEGHELIPLGSEVSTCECHTLCRCKSNEQLNLPTHISISDDFTCGLSTPMKLPPNEGSLQCFSKTQTYISQECQTNTLISHRPFCHTISPPTDNLAEDDTIWCIPDFLTQNNTTLAYFEINIIIGGTYDQIGIGITSNPYYSASEFAGYNEDSIGYHGDDGKAYLRGEGMCYGPRFGSYDTVGCGVTRYGDVYFTLNGFLLPMINSEMMGELYPLVSMRGKYSTIRINYGPQFEFRHDALLELPNPLHHLTLDKELLRSFTNNRGIRERLSDKLRVASISATGKLRMLVQWIRGGNYTTKVIQQHHATGAWSTPHQAEIGFLKNLKMRKLLTSDPPDIRSEKPFNNQPPTSTLGMRGIEEDIRYKERVNMGSLYSTKVSNSHIDEFVVKGGNSSGRGEEFKGGKKEKMEVFGVSESEGDETHTYATQNEIKLENRMVRVGPASQGDTPQYLQFKHINKKRCRGACTNTKCYIF